MNNEVVVRLPGNFQSNAEAAGFIHRAVQDALRECDEEGVALVAVVWKDKGEPWCLFMDSGAEEVEEGLVFSDE